jgi:hypothetical protein
LQNLQQPGSPTREIRGRTLVDLAKEKAPVWDPDEEGENMPSPFKKDLIKPLFKV